jgi:Mg2+-importing ATPase
MTEFSRKSTAASRDPLAIPQHNAHSGLRTRNWAIPIDRMELSGLSSMQALNSVGSTETGLSSLDAERRLAAHAPRRQVRETDLGLLLRQFRSPLVLILLVALLISWGIGERLDAGIVFAVIAISTLLGFWQERRASKTLQALLAIIQVKASVLRDGREIEVPSDRVVPGDVLVLRAGDTIPGDGVLLESKDLFVDESTLTGESYPAEKRVSSAGTDPSAQSQMGVIYDGTHVVSGTARAVLLRTGADTQFGQLSDRLRLQAPETEFERGLRKFGEMLIRVTIVLVVAILAIHLLAKQHTQPLEVFTFALALAVGITPELLPVIVSVTLARGAQRLAKEQVIVRRLSSIENLGSMSVLCSDKTGTLTEGVVHLHAAVSPQGEPSSDVLRWAVLNATHQTGFMNPIDQALSAEPVALVDDFRKFDEVPYDFIRKRLSVVMESKDSRHLMITKGAFANVLDCCTRVALASGVEPMDAWRETLNNRFESYSRDGFRVLGLACRDVTHDPVIDKDDEVEMTFAGFLLFEDPPKQGAALAIADLRRLGVRIKVITGDNRVVAGRLGVIMGIANPGILTGTDLHRMSDEALIQRVRDIDIFAETEPNQKERILIALRKGGDVVGYLGDGINDASALHAADVGISVDSAVDVAKQAADMILLRHDLGVIARGVATGRETFANSIKYILITTSANFGNMVSMAGASLFLPFLPLLPKQILLNNFLSDLPSLAISTDSVDPEQIEQSRRWDQRFIRRFMLLFGAISSVFDFLTFGTLLWVLKASESQFQTGWFIESLITELTIVMIVRTRRAFYRSKPGKWLAWATAVVVGVAFILPYTPFGGLFGFVPIPWWWLAILAGITALYLTVNERMKHLVFHWLDNPDGNKVTKSQSEEH